MKKQKSFSPPLAPRIETRLETHGDVRLDPYFWLRDKKHPETMKYLKAENEYYEQTMKPLKKVREKLFKEMKSRIREDDSSPPAPWGDYEYYTKFQKGKQYAIKCRRRKGSRKEEILLDENKLAHGKKYFSLGSFSVANSHNLLAYSVDFDGSEKYTLKFLDLKTKKDFGAQIPNTASGGVVWANDNQTLFYIVQDANLRPHRVFRHRLGQPSSQDTLIYEEKNPEFFLGLGKTASDQYILISSHAKNSSEIQFIDADFPLQKPRMIEPRKEDLEYEVEHNGDSFYLLTNANGATNFKVMRTPVAKPGKRNWKDFWGHKKTTLIGDFLMFKDWLVLFEREKANPQIHVVSLRRKSDTHLVRFKDPAYSVGPSTNFEFDTDELRINYSSMVQPSTTYDYNMRTSRRIVRKEQKVPGYKPSLYKCERLWVKGHDGTKIPLSLVYKKGLKKNGKAPTYLYSYGSYGSSTPTTFSTLRLSLLNRGFVYAIAHIRGGQEMGRQWYEDGKFLKKKNTFLDFISCADYLVKNKFTSPSRLAIAGGSAGGMLMGAVLNMRPALFQVAAAHVPFVDVLNTMLDASLPLTPMEYNEWGNPNELKTYQYIKSYSPYDNVRPQNYPNILVTAGISDPRVTYWEPAKWVARLRTTKTGNGTIVFKTNMGGGHFGASGRFEALKEYADEYAFLFEFLKVR